MPIKLADEQATNALGRALYEALPADIRGFTILLEGELGAGKSTLARALIRAAGHTGAVPSPTYTLIEPYDLERGKLYHVDLYRVIDEEELQFIGFNDLEDGCRLVEWPDRAPLLAGEADLRVTLQYAGTGREATLTGLSERGSQVAGAAQLSYPSR